MNTDHVHDVTTTTTQHVHVHDTTTTMMDHSGHGSGGNGTTDGLHDMMIMYFHAGYKELILFDFWRTKNASYFVLSCFILFAISILYEGLKLLRHRLFLNEYKRFRTYSVHSRTSVFEKATNSSMFELNASPRAGNTGFRFLQAFLHMLKSTVSYGLMLVFMTFNVWLCLSVILGAGVGFLIFANQRMRANSDVELTEHCR